MHQGRGNRKLCANSAAASPTFALSSDEGGCQPKCRATVILTPGDTNSDPHGRRVEWSSRGHCGPGQLLGLQQIANDGFQTVSDDLVAPIIWMNRISHQIRMPDDAAEDIRNEPR